MERRLAAILAADVVGYSRLMGKDEAGTLLTLKAQREQLIEPEIADHHGRIVKLMGDGLLAEFSSVVEAVQCAADIQQGIAERNSDVDEYRRMIWRIGVNQAQSHSVNIRFLQGNNPKKLVIWSGEFLLAGLLVGDPAKAPFLNAIKDVEACLQ